MDISSQNNDVGITEGKKEEVWQVVEYVDAFLLSSGEHVLDCVHVLPNLLERMNSGRNKFGEEPKDDKSFLNVVDHIFKLSTCNTCNIALDQTSSILEKTMSFLSAIPTKYPPLGQDQDNQEFPFNFSTQKISIFNKISTTMIATGYKIECCMAFANFRQGDFKIELQRFGHRNMKMEDVYKMPWESLEGEITTWNQVIWHCTTVLFNTEQRLYDSKLFKFLDMFMTLREDIVGEFYLEPCTKELAYETTTTKDMIIEAIVAMFCDLKNSIKNDNERIHVLNSAIHPLTRYVMNYLKYACEYKDTLEQVFEQGQGVNIEGIEIQNHKSVHEEVEDLYRDLALHYFFLMNNGRYIVQKVKGCVELHELMGANWCRRRQSGLRLYHKCYQRKTWSKLTRNKVSKQLVKKRFKCFNAMFEEIHKTQCTWMVSDEQLQSKLRISISALVILA
ncbi:Exocyst complex component EXO70B1 [Glycine soja]